MNVDCDVAIIGAGPAGSTLAALLAQRGLSVVIVDRDTFPRDKLCGEFLSYDALPILERSGVIEAIDDAGASRIRRCRLIGVRDTYAFDFPAEARGISRRTMDHLLLRRAVDTGATAMEGWEARSVETGAERSSVIAKRGDESAKISARVLCGAWGRWGRFDRLFFRPFTNRRADRRFGFKRHYVVTNSHVAPPHDTIDLYSFGHGYLGVNRIEGDLSNICGLVHERRLRGHRGGWPVFVESLRYERETLDRLYEGHEPAQADFLSSEPVVFTPRSVVESHIILMGDAAGLIDPLAGNGMAMAIQSAALAATLVNRFLGGETDRATFESAYVARHDELFASRIHWSRRIARLLTRPRALDLAISLHPSPGIGHWLLERTRASTEELERVLEELG